MRQALPSPPTAAPSAPAAEAEPLTAPPMAPTQADGTKGKQKKGAGARAVSVPPPTPLPAPVAATATKASTAAASEPSPAGTPEDGPLSVRRPRGVADRHGTVWASAISDAFAGVLESRVVCLYCGKVRAASQEWACRQPGVGQQGLCTDPCGGARVPL
jgi:hypothetical protein